MTTHTGNEGTVKLGANSIGEARTWQVEESAGTVADTVIGDQWETHKLIQKSWTGSADVLWDEADLAQVAGAIGASVTIAFYPTGSGAGETYKTGTATVDKLTLKGTYNGLVEYSMSFKGNGPLNTTTVGA